MRRGTLVVLVAVAACGRRDEPDPPAPRAITSAVVSPAASTLAGTAASAPASAATGAAPALPTVVVAPRPSASASTAPSASASASPSTGASTGSAASASASASASAIAPGFVGTWVFARFDLDDPTTRARWAAIPADAQKEILASAPEARLVVGAGTLRTRLAGVPDKTSTYVVEPGATATTFVIATSDQGRKEIRLLPGDAMRVLDLDAPGSMATIFRRGT